MLKKTAHAGFSRSLSFPKAALQLVFQEYFNWNAIVPYDYTLFPKSIYVNNNSHDYSFIYVWNQKY